MRLFRYLAPLVLAATLTVSPAQAEPLKVVTVVTTFESSGSGWRVDEAIAAWNQAQPMVRFVHSTTPGAVTVYVHRYSANDGYGGYALGGDVWLNEAYHPRSTWNTDYTRCMSASIVAHELGHTIGLGHSPWYSDLMFGGARAGVRPTCAQPSQGDVAALATLMRTST